MLLSPIGSPSKTLAQLILPPLPHELELELVLPVELILYIVELAVASSRRTAATLCRVSSWVRDAALPAMYHTLVLHSNTSSPFPALDHDVLDPGDGLLMRKISSATRIISPSPTPPRTLPSPLRFVEHLWLDLPQDRCPADFNACPNLVQLAIHLDAAPAVCYTHRWLAPSFMGEQLSGSPCRSLTVLGQSHTTRWSPFTHSPVGCAFLAGITHLRILNMCLSAFLPLDYLPHLTHLCLPYFDLRASEAEDFAALDHVLRQPQLHMVVLTLNPSYWRFKAMTLKQWACCAMTRDTRLYVVASSRTDATRDWEDPRRDWEHEAAGGQSIWEKAVCVRRKFLARLSRTFD